uniref:SAM domain-containing protein n=1 Tax=Meloidogyne incognita TaxID=6306 RepID=A0A914M3Q3_MELIC
MLGLCGSSASYYKLCDELIAVEKRLLGVLEAAFSDRQERIRTFCNVAASSSSNHLQQEQNNLLISSLNEDSGIGSGGTLTTNATTGDVDCEGDESIRDWLRRIGCDLTSILLIESECYTKRDLLELVTREELIRLGIRGGIACRIWRHIVRSRMDRSNFKVLSPTSPTTTTNSICNTPPLTFGSSTTFSSRNQQRH